MTPDHLMPELRPHFEGAPRWANKIAIIRTSGLSPVLVLRTTSLHERVRAESYFNTGWSNRSYPGNRLFCSSVELEIDGVGIFPVPTVMAVPTDPDPERDRWVRVLLEDGTAGVFLLLQREIGLAGT
jgi:hypothetical protein